jgi:PhzF family phenazine biosynthesis protein
MPSLSNRCSLKGNQLAVVDITDKSLSHQRKQQIAREFNFSESVFLTHGGPGRNPRAEIFTPVNEMEFAGHPVIGSGHVLFQGLLGSYGAGQSMTLDTKAGPVTIEYDPATRVVSAGVPHNVHVHEKQAPLSALVATQKALADFSGLDSTYPTVSMVKGVTYVLGDFTKQPEAFASLAAGPSPAIDLNDEWSPSFVGVMYYRTLQSRVENQTTIWDLRVRMIAINLEDPACGSGSCALGSYLALQSGQQSRKHRFNIDQGSEIGRDSQIIVNIELNESRKKVESMQLAGPAALVTQGKIFLD